MPVEEFKGSRLCGYRDMAQIGASDGRVTILIEPGLWLQSTEDDLTDVKMKMGDISSHLRQSFRGAIPLIDALARRDVRSMKHIITAFDDISQVGKFSVRKLEFNGQLEHLWGFSPLMVSRNLSSS